MQSWQKKPHRNNQYPFTSPKWFETLSKLQESGKSPNYTRVTNSMVSKTTRPQGSHLVLGDNWPFLSGQVLMDVPLQAGISCWNWGETGALLWPSVEKKFKLSLLLIKGQPRKHSSGETLCIFYLTGCERHYPFLIFELGWRLLWQICFRMKLFCCQNFNSFKKFVIKVAE